MVVYTKITIDGTEIIADTCSVTKSLGDIDSTSEFEITINNYNGDKSTDFTIGDEVLIYVEKDVSPPTKQIFTGILESVDLEGEEQKEILTLSGRDYSARLIDRTVEPEVYNNLTAGSIVKNIVSKYTNDITTTNVDNGATISRIAFNQVPVYDAIRQLAENSNYMFYIDNSKDLHFKEPETTSSGYTLGSTNILSTTFKERRDSVYNEVWVYGDRYLDGFKETFTGDGAGSEFTLLYKPHNTSITVDSTAVQPGGIYNMNYGLGSEVRYLVNFDDKKIVFTSGTNQGDNIPGAGSSIIVSYLRDLPIVKVGENDVSVDKYKRRVKVIQDTSIKDPLTAEAILLKELEEYSDPVKEGTLKLRNIDSLNPGETCVVNIPIYGINNVTYKILESHYELNKATELNGNVLSIKVNKKIPDITDTLKDILLQLKNLQGQGISDSDLLTRYKISTGSFGLRMSGCEVYQRSVAGDNIILNHSAFGLLDTYKCASSSGLQISFVLSRNPQGLLGTATLGQNLSTWVLSWSGGYF